MTKAYATFGLTPWSTDGKPPSRFRLFKFGENRSTKGTVYLTVESAKKCLSAWIDYGNDLSGDYNHAITNPNIESPRASCWFSLALERDGLYAVNVKFTPAAHEAICNKEYRYYSPYFAIESDNKNRPCVVEIINVALTNTPATKNQRPLVGLSRQEWSNQMMDQKMIDALKALFTEKGGPEEGAADFVLSAMALMGGAEEAPAEIEEYATPPQEEMPMADPLPDDKKAEEMGVESYKKAFNALEAQVKGLSAELASIKAEKAKEQVNAKEQLFAQFKREGRFQFIKEEAARELMGANFELFKKTFSAVQPLTQRAPAAPPLKAIVETKVKPTNLTAPMFDDAEVKAHMKQNNTDYKTSLLALSRVQKGQ